MDEIRQFIINLDLDAPDYPLGARLLGLYIASQAATWGIPPDSIPVELAEQIRQQLLTLETETPSVAPLQLALHAAAKGNFEKAGRIFRKHSLELAYNHIIVDEANTGRRRQKAYAKKDRSDPLQKLIISIMKENSNITQVQLIDKLLSHKFPNGIIHDITSEEISWGEEVEGLRDTPISGLKDRMRRARIKNLEEQKKRSAR